MSASVVKTCKKIKFGFPKFMGSSLQLTYLSMGIVPLVTSVLPRHFSTPFQMRLADSKEALDQFWITPTQICADLAIAWAAL